MLCCAVLCRNGIGTGADVRFYLAERAKVMGWSRSEEDDSNGIQKQSNLDAESSQIE
jgi:hypothetical protein